MNDYTSDQAVQQRKEAAALARAAASRRFHAQQERQQRRYLGSQQAAKRYLHMAYANGATTFPQEIYQRATAVAATIIQQETYTMNDQQFAKLVTILEAIQRDIQALACASEPDFRRTPEGLPICPKHGAVMGKREKQGDEWYSHQIADPSTGEIHYCRGYHTKNGTGWQIEPETAVSQPASPAPTNGRLQAPPEIFEYCYGDGTPVPDHPKTRSIFNQYRRAHAEQPPASSQALAAWHSNHQAA